MLEAQVNCGESRGSHNGSLYLSIAANNVIFTSSPKAASVPNGTIYSEQVSTLNIPFVQSLHMMSKK